MLTATLRHTTPSAPDALLLSADLMANDRALLMEQAADERLCVRWLDESGERGPSWARAARLIRRHAQRKRGARWRFGFGLPAAARAARLIGRHAQHQRAARWRSGFGLPAAARASWRLGVVRRADDAPQREPNSA